MAILNKDSKKSNKRIIPQETKQLIIKGDKVDSIKGDKRIQGSIGLTVKKGIDGKCFDPQIEYDIREHLQEGDIHLTEKEILLQVEPQKAVL